MMMTSEFSPVQMTSSAIIQINIHDRIAPHDMIIIQKEDLSLKTKKNLTEYCNNTFSVSCIFLVAQCENLPRT